MTERDASSLTSWACMWRAIAHDRMPAAKFEDPTALALLSDEVRERVVRIREGQPGWRDRFGKSQRKEWAKTVVARTVAVDEAVRTAVSPQVVILGAGLDGRAWRMPELREATVFEVDHPSLQREKRARVGALRQVARDVRFVPLDFERGGLDEGLAAVGHDPESPTTWLWEHVKLLSLTPGDLEAVLAIVGRRSAVGSRLVLNYDFVGAVGLALVSILGNQLPKPLRSAFTWLETDQMRASVEAVGAGVPELIDRIREVLARNGFQVVRDESIATLAAGLSRELVRGMDTRLHNATRVVVADRQL